MNTNMIVISVKQQVNIKEGIVTSYIAVRKLSIRSLYVFIMMC